MPRGVGVQVPPDAPYVIRVPCPLRLSARTSGSHPGKRGSIPLEGAIRIKAILANLAQLVEQIIRNDQVTGSNPLVGSIFQRRLRRQTPLTFRRAPHGGTASNETVCDFGSGP